jgi:hypothetical protein
LVDVRAQPAYSHGLVFFKSNRQKKNDKKLNQNDALRCSWLCGAIAGRGASTASNEDNETSLQLNYSILTNMNNIAR